MVLSFDIPDRVLVAIGGNATHPEDIEGTSREQKAIAASTAEALLPLALLDNELVITHGNGGRRTCGNGYDRRSSPSIQGHP